MAGKILLNFGAWRHLRHSLYSPLCICGPLSSVSLLSIYLCPFCQPISISVLWFPPTCILSMSVFLSTNFTWICRGEHSYFWIFGHPYTGHKNIARQYVSMKSSKKLKVNLATIVEGNQKAPFSIATTPRCKRGHYSFPRIAPIYPWYIPYIAES